MNLLDERIDRYKGAVVPIPSYYSRLLGYGLILVVFVPSCRLLLSTGRAFGRAILARSYATSSVAEEDRNTFALVLCDAALGGCNRRPVLTRVRAAAGGDSRSG